jgi:hypothetical protein
MSRRARKQFARQKGRQLSNQSNLRKERKTMKTETPPSLATDQIDVQKILADPSPPPALRQRTKAPKQKLSIEEVRRRQSEGGKRSAQVRKARGTAPLSRAQEKAVRDETNRFERTTQQSLQRLTEDRRIVRANPAMSSSVPMSLPTPDFSPPVFSTWHKFMLLRGINCEVVWSFEVKDHTFRCMIDGPIGLRGTEQGGPNVDDPVGSGDNPWTALDALWEQLTQPNTVVFLDNENRAVVWDGFVWEPHRPSEAAPPELLPERKSA